VGLKLYSLTTTLLKCNITLAQLNAIPSSLRGDCSSFKNLIQCNRIKSMVITGETLTLAMALLFSGSEFLVTRQLYQLCMSVQLFSCKCFYCIEPFWTIFTSFRLLRIILNRLKTFLNTLDHYGTYWSKMFQNIPMYSKMFGNVPKCFKMFQNVPKCSKMLQNILYGSKCSQMV
jgi:hypothetical protein